ncbi:MAG: YggT family protein [Candidatus Peregrinibacteria bacterium]
MNFLAFFFINIIRIEKYAILLRILISWISPDPSSRLNQFLFQITEPLLAPIRNLLPRTGMIDFSPLLVFLLLDLAQVGVAMLMERLI